MKLLEAQLYQRILFDKEYQIQIHTYNFKILTCLFTVLFLIYTT